MTLLTLHHAAYSFTQLVLALLLHTLLCLSLWEFTISLCYAWPCYLHRALGLWPSQVAWLQKAEHLFYAFHWYGLPVKDPNKAIQNVRWFIDSWEMPALMTEFNSCDVKVSALRYVVSVLVRMQLIATC